METNSTMCKLQQPVCRGVWKVPSGQRTTHKGDFSRKITSDLWSWSWVLFIRQCQRPLPWKLINRWDLAQVSSGEKGPGTLLRVFGKKRGKKKKNLPNISEKANRAAGPFAQEAHAQRVSGSKVLRRDTLNVNTNSGSKYKEPALVISGFSRSLARGLVEHQKCDPQGDRLGVRQPCHRFCSAVASQQLPGWCQQRALQHNQWKQHGLWSKSK